MPHASSTKCSSAATCTRAGNRPAEFSEAAIRASTTPPHSYLSRLAKRAQSVNKRSEADLNFRLFPADHFAVYGANDEPGVDVERTIPSTLIPRIFHVRGMARAPNAAATAGQRPQTGVLHSSIPTDDEIIRSGNLIPAEQSSGRAYVPR